MYVVSRFHLDSNSVSSSPINLKSKISLVKGRGSTALMEGRGGQLDYERSTEINFDNSEYRSILLRIRNRDSLVMGIVTAATEALGKTASATTTLPPPIDRPSI